MKINISFSLSSVADEESRQIVKETPVATTFIAIKQGIR